MLTRATRNKSDPKFGTTQELKLRRSHMIAGVVLLKPVLTEHAEHGIWDLYNYIILTVGAVLLKPVLTQHV